ncbi:MAG TPA: hypothetical protein VG407_16235 [Caulobacteraceae bacterium]|jgi:hypothetical protein|nr:hypothetical protein [Caulobacteraceae bacterium]
MTKYVIVSSEHGHYLGVVTAESELCGLIELPSWVKSVAEATVFPSRDEALDAASKWGDDKHPVELSRMTQIARSRLQ